VPSQQLMLSFDKAADTPGDKRSPLRPELAALLDVWPSSQLAQCATGRGRRRLYGNVCCTSVLLRCAAYAARVPVVRISSGWANVLARSFVYDAAVQRVRETVVRYRRPHPGKRSIAPRPSQASLQGG
jgi:hypothetical protein